MGPLLAFLIALLAAIVRGLIAEAAGHALEPSLAERFPAVPHYACAAIALIAAVIAIEALALLLEWLIGHFRGRE